MRFHRHLTQMDRGSQSRRIDRSVDAFHHCDIYVISFSEGSIYRRGARRWRKLYRVNGHIFQAKRFNRVSIIPFNYHCATCTLFISPSLSLCSLSYAIFAKVDLSQVQCDRRNRRSVQSTSN